MPEQRLQTQLQLDAVLTGGYKDAFRSASDLMSDLKKESSDLKKELMKIGKEADGLDKVGESSKALREDMKLLEQQIKETGRATEKFEAARSHFRSASIGARALKEDLAGIINTAKTAAIAVAGIGTAAAVALSPSEELLAFDQAVAGIAAISPEVDPAGIEEAKSVIRGLSNTYGISAAEIASQHQQLTRSLGFDAAQETISAAVEFQTTTGLSITDIEEELATAKISLGIDTPAETQKFLELLQQAHAQGIKIDNIDLGDLETLRARTGEDVFGENFQREFLTTIAFKQVDSFQFGDYATAFKEEIERAVLITPEMDAKEITKAQDSLATLEKWGIRAEDGLVGAMQIYQQLSEADRVQFVTELEPVLTAMPAEVIARGSEALPQVTQQVEAILSSERSLTDAAEDVANTWSGIWGRIGTVGTNTLGILQEEFAVVFGAPILSTASRFFDFIASRQDEIRNFFTNIQDKASPVIENVWNTVKQAYPDIKQFATDVWDELKRQWQAVEPAARAVWDVVWGITKAVGGFLKEHPRLVATVISGIAAWKAYQLAASGVSVIKDVVGGAIKLTQGHIHRLNAMILENARLQGTFQTASMSASRMIGGIGRAALGAIPGIGAMGGSLIAAMMPALPVILPVIGAAAALGAAGYLVYRNWDGISDFFSTHFDTIRNTLLLVFPPLGLLVGMAGVIKDNWEGIKEFFSTLWETVRLASQVAFEFIQYVALSGLVFIKNAWAGITEFFAGLWQGVRDFFVATPLAPIFEWMTAGVRAVVMPLWDFFSDLWGNISKKAGEVIGWITSKFEVLNSVLDKAFGWLRDENEKLRDELNITGDISAPAIEKPTTETPEVLMPDAPALTSPEIEKPEIETTSPKGFIEQNTPSAAAAEIADQTPVGVASPEAVSQLDLKAVTQDELVSIGLGQLSEIRKQTMLLESLKGDTIVEVLPVKPVEMPGIESSVIDIPETPRIDPSALEMPRTPEIESPVLDMPGTLEINLTSVSDAIQQQVPVPSDVSTVEMPSVEMPVFESPQVEIDTPELVFEDYTLPSVPSEAEMEANLREGVSGTPEQNTSAPVTITNHFTIIQQPGQDAEDLARVVAEMVREQMDEEAETYLVQ